jgi:hypothetical protein
MPAENREHSRQPTMHPPHPAVRTPITIALCLGALALYAASLFLPVFTCGRTPSFQGYVVLLIGPLGLLALDPRWLGNAAFVLLVAATGLDAQARRRPRIALATAALAIAAFAPAAGCEGSPGSEASNTSTGLAYGGYLWVGALLMACAANLSLRPSPGQPPEFADTLPDRHQP